MPPTRPHLCSLALLLFAACTKPPAQPALGNDNARAPASALDAPAPPIVPVPAPTAPGRKPLDTAALIRQLFGTTPARAAFSPGLYGVAFQDAETVYVTMEHVIHHSTAGTAALEVDRAHAARLAIRGTLASTSDMSQYTTGGARHSSDSNEIARWLSGTSVVTPFGLTYTLDTIIDTRGDKTALSPALVFDCTAWSAPRREAGQPYSVLACETRTQPPYPLASVGFPTPLPSPEPLGSETDEAPWTLRTWLFVRNDVAAVHGAWRDQRFEYSSVASHPDTAPLRAMLTPPAPPPPQGLGPDR